MALPGIIVDGPVQATDPRLPSLPDHAMLLARHGARATPRYTSYPTAPHFVDGFRDAEFRRWLAQLAVDRPISLYLHVPYCRQMCWYCGCNMRLAKDYAPVAAYAETLLQELDLLAGALPGRLTVDHLHWGGGTPTALSPEHMTHAMNRVREHFEFTADAELALEADPRTLTEAMIDRVGELGFTRASFGVQEFDPVVQQAIQRIQPPEMVQGAVDALRRAGVEAINFDLIYGLPHQTAAKLLDTIDRCAAMAPDRVALFGYAHVPWKATNQRMISEEALPGGPARAEQAARAADRLVEHGYVPIGLDHFARPDDELARAAAAGTMRRNFQGYTTDDAETLLAVGTTGIGRTPSGYYQNLPGVRAWSETIAAGRLPVAKSRAFEGDDVLRGEVIEQIMCRGRADCAEIARRHGAAEDWAEPCLRELDALATEGIVTLEGHTVTLADWARPLARVVAAAFDRYLDEGKGRHAVSV
jgi:oxygen-independent coproporphyrinogen-3 oxidase